MIGVAKALRAISNKDLEKLRQRYLYLFHLNTKISALTNLEIWIMILAEYFEEEENGKTKADEEPRRN